MARINEGKKTYTIIIDYGDPEEDTEEINECSEEQVLNILKNFKEGVDFFEIKETGLWEILRKKDIRKINVEEEEKEDENEDENDEDGE